MVIEFKQKNGKSTENNDGTRSKICAFQTRSKQQLDEKIALILKNGASSSSYKEVSKSYKGMKKYDKAIDALKKAKEYCQFDSEIYYELGINHLLNRQNNDARKNFIRSIKLDKSNINAQIQLGIAHELMDEEFMAIAIYKKIIEENPTYILAYNHLATLYIELQSYGEALDLFAKILSFKPDYYRANLGLGICFDKLGKYSSAIRFYKKYIIKKPKSKTSFALANRIADIYSKKTFQTGNLSVVGA